MGNYDIDYNDERFTQVESDKNEALSELEKTYDDMIGKSDQYYQEQIDASKDWAERQQQLQQEKTDFAIERIEQQKAQANKDYLKEQSGAYVDWQKQSNKYGANAEAMAAQGLAGSGYSESSQVSMYNTYQNRIASARESYQNAVLNYNNAITEARMQNNALLAEIAYNAFQQQLELALQGFQYNNQLILDKSRQMIELENMYYGRYQDVLAQINHENALAEQIRQYNESMAENKRQFDASLAARYAGSDNPKVVIEPDDMEDSKPVINAPVKPTGNTKKNTERIEQDTGVKPQKKSGVDPNEAFTGTTANEAYNYMRKKGVPNAYAVPKYTAKQWNEMKKAGNTAAEVANYNSYQDYLRDYCAYAISVYA